MKKYTVLWLETAKENFIDIVQYLKSVMTSEAARKVYNNLINDINQLEEFPYAHPFVQYEEYRKQGVRILITGKYSCFYRIEGTSVEIHHIVHQSQDYNKLFFFKSGGSKT